MKLSAPSGVFQVRTSPVSVHWSVTLAPEQNALLPPTTTSSIPFATTSKHIQTWLWCETHSKLTICWERSEDGQDYQAQHLLEWIFTLALDSARAHGHPGRGRDSEWQISQEVGQNVSIDCRCHFAGVIDLHRELWGCRLQQWRRRWALLP